MIRNRLKAHRQNQVPVPDLQLDHPDAQAPHVGAPSNPLLVPSFACDAPLPQARSGFQSLPKTIQCEKV